MIPEFNDAGLLPEGIYNTTQEDFENRFVRFDGSDRRFRVYEGLRQLLHEIAKADVVRRVFVAGSFVTAKPDPNDFDCLLILDASIRSRELPPFEYRFVSARMARKVFGGDILCALDGSVAEQEVLEFFQTTREGIRQGIVEIEL